MGGNCSGCLLYGYIGTVVGPHRDEVGSNVPPGRNRRRQSGVIVSEMDTKRERTPGIPGAGVIVLALCGALVTFASWACGGGEMGDAAKTSVIAPVITAAPGADERATLRGTLTLDGAPLQTQFLGVRVMRADGLAVACQDAIPAVTLGSYEIPVAADAEVRGCGAPGAELVLWAYVGDSFVFSTQSVAWPGSGATVTFDATFVSNDPEGASKPVTEFKGQLFDRDGSRLSGGTIVEAYVRDVRCGATELRYGNVTDGYYTLIVAGPQSVPGCDEGATLTFRLNAMPAVETATNDLGRTGENHVLNLTVK
jgi:hypothetical protein